MSSLNSTQPNVAQIPLPPGLTLAQFQALQGTIVNVAIGMAVAVGIVIWDFLSMIPAERELFQQKDKKLWRTPAAWAFMVLRYSGLLAMVPGLFFTSLQNRHCQLTASLSQGGVVLVTASSGVIFSYRVFAIWRYNKIVVAVISILYLFMVCCWIAVGSQLRATQGPATPFGSNCLLHGVPTWDPISFASSVVFDSVILFLTVTKLREDEARNSAVGNQILRDNFIYFVIVSITNVVVLVINCLSPRFTAAKLVSLPYPTLMTTAMGTRVYLNLRLYHQRKHANETLPSGSSVPFGSQATTAVGPIQLNSMKSGVMVLQSTQIDHDHGASKTGF